MFVGGRSEMSDHFYFFNVKYLQATHFITTFAVGLPDSARRVAFPSANKKELKV
jgi:hypothetical protein